MDRAELLVACHELVLEYLNPIRTVVEKVESRRSLGFVMDRLGAKLPWNDLDPWSVPASFWSEFQELRAGERLLEVEVLARGTLGALDASLQMVGRRHLPPRQIEKSFFRRLGYWVIATNVVEGCPPWSAPAESDPASAGAGEEAQVTVQSAGSSLTGLSPMRWMSFMRILPYQRNGVSFRLAELDYELDQRLPSGEAWKSDATLNIAVSPLSRSIQPGCSRHGEVIQENKSFSIYSFEEDKKGLDKLGDLLCNTVLPACADSNVAILILPELTISPGLRARLSQALRQRERVRALETPGRPPRPVLIVAGSYHEPDATGRVVNRSVVLDYRGLPVGLSAPSEESTAWSHDKVARFLFETRQLFNGDKGELLKALERGMGLDREGISGGTEPEVLGQSFTIVGSRIGQVSVAICIDYLTHCKNWHDEVQGAWIDWVWVPAATTRVDDFRQIARNLAIQGTGTVAVNACWLCEALQAWKDQWAGLAHLPGNLGRWLDSGSRSVPHAALCPRSCSGEGCLFVFSLQSLPN